MKKVRILDHAQIHAKLGRMAYEIAERNFEGKEILLIGLNERGFFLAGKIFSDLKKISSAKINLSRANKLQDNGVRIEEKNPEKLILGKIVIIVDDVLYSGATLFETLTAVMPHNPVSVQSAILIDRGHRNIPVSPDYVGLSLATTLKQHVSVVLSEGGKSVEAFLE